MRIPAFVLAAALTLSLAPSGLALAPSALDRTGLTGPTARITTLGATTAPVGLQIFCLRSPAHCKGGPATQVQLDAAMMNALNSVNRSVNSSIRPVLRPTQVWELGARSGDCKDYAMNKRARLIEMGVPAGALRLAIGYTSRGEGHAVLVVRTDQGDLVLDNLTGQIKPFNQTGHRLIAISSPDLRKWNSVA
ncbi:transglutaminase-like cysteine peptidase [Pelagibacterium limicola]|uniref:transglutaminase-like cysteine peptidase n=1 Tax=Pelagibacterium limicola TaxID=2791022 RepID=UPI0018AFBA4C|nr:transglutaminase-like cysteine peptidase [Pelagibacterium limicola]